MLGTQAMDTSAHQLFHALRVREVRPDADDAAIVCFDVPAELAAHFAYQPGQFLTLRHVLGGEEVRRSYSICDWGEPGALRIGVRLVPGCALEITLMMILLADSAFLPASSGLGASTTIL